MDAIQRLREKARANNKLVSTKQQKVTVKQQESKQVIVIEPTDPNTMYVPYYEPATVYGAWPYADYPPYYFGYPSYIGAGVVAAGLAFGTAWAIGRWGNYWGGGCNWGNRNVYVNHRTTNVWQSQSGASAGRPLQQRRTSSSASATTTFAPAPTTGWISAARAASRCSIPVRIVRMRAIARGRSCRRSGRRSCRRPSGRSCAATVPAIVATRAAVTGPNTADRNRGNAGNAGNRAKQGGGANRAAAANRATRRRHERVVGPGCQLRRRRAAGRASPARGGGGCPRRRRRWRLPRWRRWWRRWRRRRRRWPALGHRAEARRRPARPSRQRPRLLPLQLSTAATRPMSASSPRKCRRCCPKR